jgi:hypothetical protein
MAARISKQEWMANRLLADIARGAHSGKINTLPRYDPTKGALATRPNSRRAEIIPRDQWTPNQRKIFAKIQSDIADRRAGKPATSKVTTPADIAKEKTDQLTRQIAKKAPKHSTIHSTVPSTCLEDLTWKDGVATATFYRGGAIVYDYEMSLDDFLDWVNSDSIGKFGNAEVFD